MAVTKRTRYEVLRRDANTCRYCGQSAPDVRLTIDHVTPVALGGADTPDNLVAACADCNAGKSSSTPDAQLVADVTEEAVRFAALTKAAWTIVAQQYSQEHDYVEEAAESIKFPVPSDWRESIGRFFRLGVPLEIVSEAALIAGGKPDPWGKMDRFAYLCGIIYNHCRDVGAAVETRLDWEGNWFTESDLCDQRIEAYEHGWAGARRAGVKTNG